MDSEKEKPLPALGVVCSCAASTAEWTPSVVTRSETRDHEALWTE
jgi:hypothetical protein